MHRITIQFNKTKVLHVVNQTFLSILVYFRIWKFTSLEIYSQTTITLSFTFFHWSLSRQKKNRMPQDRRRKEDEQPHCLLPRINVTLCGAAARGERSYSDQKEKKNSKHSEHRRKSIFEIKAINIYSFRRISPKLHCFLGFSPLTVSRGSCYLVPSNSSWKQLFCFSTYERRLNAI